MSAASARDALRRGLIDTHAGTVPLEADEADGGTGDQQRVGRWLHAARAGLWRLLGIVATLLGVSFVTFLLLEFVPGDPAQVAAGEFATPADVARVRAQMGLDEPFFVRWAHFVAHAVHGDLGTSLQVRPGTGVGGVIWAAVPVTASLTIAAMAIAAVISIPCGLIAALRPRSVFDRAVSFAASTALAVPPHVLGLVLLTVFAVNHALLPSLGYVPLGADPVAWLQHIVLPALTLAAVPLAEMTRQTRGALIDTLDQDYIRAATARGLRRWQVVGKHALKNSAAPVTTVAGLQFARTLGGAVVVERIFNLPGIGSLTYSAVAQRDLPLIIGIVMVSAIIVLLVNLIVDVLNDRLAPRHA